MGDSLPKFLAAEQLGQIVVEDAFELEIAEEELQRNEMSGNAGRGEFLPVEPAGIIGQVADRQVDDGPIIEPNEKPLHIAAIRSHGILGQMALASRILDKRLDPRPSEVFWFGRLGSRWATTSYGHGAVSR